MDRTSDHGVALVDVIVATTISVVVSAAAIPVVAGAMDHERARVGGEYLMGQIKRTQLEALRRGACVALRFTETDDGYAWQMFADGNGNGVLSADIESGVDPPIGTGDRLGDHARGVDLRLNQRVPDMGGGAALEAYSNPLRIGRSTLLSFSPEGAATSGTLYVAAARGPQFAVRVMGATGRARLLRFDAGAAAWLP